jgi:hypothetical protein
MVHPFAYNDPDAIVVDRNRIDADPDRNVHFDANPKLDRMPIHMRILPQILHMLLT